ncbi:MAG TPA: trypsin-like peptidase domain-containing protein [Spirochaetota bacterium]|nr:trypsin-like peptidase domain-containing protein [Spirochaetota bacterium]
MKRNTRKRYLLLSALLCATITAFSSISLISCNDITNAFGSDSQSPLKGSPEAVKAWEIQKTFRKINELYHERVVSISTEQTVKLPQHPFFDDPFFNEFFGRSFRQNNSRQRVQKRRGLGTGFVISEDGYICTNHHVVKNVDKVTVKINEKIYNAKVIGSDERTDVALLKVDSSDTFKPVFLGNSDNVRVGDWAIAIGNPFGLDKTFTVGVVSATGRRDLDLMGGSQSHIQTDASINPGNSGGPLINIDGEVIGINRMIYSRSGGYMGIGFAIPINQATSILTQLKKYKKIKRGYIGVQIVPLTEDYAKQIGLQDDKGALVGAVVPDGPAEKGGVIVGDVILKADSTEINTYHDLVQVVERTEIGKALRLSVWRDRNKVNLFITVKERP